MLYNIKYVRLYNIPYYSKLTRHEIKVLEINANLMENDLYTFPITFLKDKK